MTPHELYREATKRGLRLKPAGEKLAVFPKGKCPPDFADMLRAHKGELLNWLSHPPCPGWQSVPPDNLPLNPASPRPTPHDRERMIAYMLRQGGDRPGQLTAWLVKRGTAYFEGPGRHWDCALHTYAAARDAACWQLNRSERDVLELLAGFESKFDRTMTPTHDTAHLAKALGRTGKVNSSANIDHEASGEQA